MISILHPSRQRAKKSMEVCLKWLQSAGTDKIELIITIDRDDPELDSYNDNFANLVNAGHDVALITNYNRSAVDAINSAALESHGDIMMVVSDDTECFDGWGDYIITLVQGKTDWILKTQDGIQPWVITMPIMDRTYFTRFGYIYHPDYKHQFCDTELTCVADMTGRKIISNVLFPHNHHSLHAGSADEVSVKADLTFESGRKIFIDRKKRNFDLPTEMVKAKMEDNVYFRMQ